MDRTRQGLLKKYKSAKNNLLPSSSVHQFSKNSGSGHKYFKSSTHEPNSKYQYNKFNQPFINNQRTMLYSNLSQSKSKYKLTKNKPVSNFSLNKNLCQRTVLLNKHPVSQCKKPVLSSDNSSKEASKVPSASSMKETSNSLALIKEIESLTKMLKKTSEVKSKAINSSVRSGNVINKPPNSKTSNSNFKFCADSKLNDTKHKSMFSKINDPFKNELKINTSAEFAKKSCNISQIDFVSDKKRENISVHLNSLEPNKYCYKKENTEKLLSSKTVCSPLKAVDNEKNSNTNVQKSPSQSHLQKATSQNTKLVAVDTSCEGIKIEMKSSTQYSNNLKFHVTPNHVISRTKINKLHQNTLHKSQNLLKTSDVAKICGTNSKYKRVNTNHSVILNKNLRLKTASHLRSPFTKRTKRQVNTKFKVINKSVTPCINRKVVLNKGILGCKENSPLVVDKSDPLFKLLNDSTVDKLEKDLLAISTTLTSSPTSGKNYCKGLKNKLRKMDTKLSPKQMSLKKPKARISKYKVVNSGASKSSTFVNSSNFTNLKNVKKTKYSVVNKRTLPKHVTPVKQEKSVLIKRLFKSKNAIVNKNVNSSYSSAKMIKCKYFSLNKRKSFEKPALYSKTSFLKPNFKGYLSAQVYYKKGRVQKGRIVTYSQRTARNVSRYGYNRHTNLFNRSFSGNNSKRKFNCGYRQSPVVFIRGLKYSCNSSGKTLRKLPTQDFSKLHQKFTFNGKRYVKIHENKIKAVAPTSANLASRVLHRSITRVLSASSKKKLIKVNRYCMFYNRFGRCNRGVKCTYIHDPSKIAVCTRFLRGTCKVDGCPFSHEITPGKMAICSFFLVGACDNDNCPYRHESLSPNAALCKAFVQGYCPRGKECQKAHILICPKYIQGNCEKGASCAFPHPPHKERKNVQKETNEESEPEASALFEKVARYFQPNENTSVTCEEKSDDIAAVKTFVPKHKRRLEEQPSFIPLSDSTFE